MVIANSLLHCASRGHIHITSGTDVYAPPQFDPGFLSHPADVVPLLWAYKKTKEICQRMPAFIEDGIGSQLPAKGPGEIGDLEYDALLEKFARGRAMTTFHPSYFPRLTILISSATCAMKPREKDGVVDKELNVYGTQNLKVAGISLLATGFN